MHLKLTIENETALPDGGPIEVVVSGKRGIDVGRYDYLDWVLPDATRFISGKHCEVRYRDGGYWLKDVSTNGTFINGSDRRVQGDHRLKNGDRLEIGHYLIRVVIDGEQEIEVEPVRPGAHGDVPWTANAGASAPPAHARDFMPRDDRAGSQAGPLDWFVDVPAPLPAPPGSSDVRGAQAWDVMPSPSPARPAPPRPQRASPPEADAWQPAGEQPAEPFSPAGSVAQEPYQQQAPIQPPAMARATAADADLMRRIARAAGIPDAVIASRDPGELADEIGAILALVTDQTRQLLAARAEAKGAIRSANQTMVQSLDNNPLRFCPSAEEAMRVMFVGRHANYLDARRAFEQSFLDIKTHQVDMFVAMQHALQLLIKDLDPKSIQASAPEEGGLGAVIGSKKARFWDTYVTRWQAKVEDADGGLLSVFMRYFSEAYDQVSRRR